MRERDSSRDPITPTARTTSGQGEQTCPKCGVTTSWGSTSWCPACGFYPRLGTHVEVEQPSPVAVATERQPSAWDLTPSWVKVAAGVGFASLAEVIAVAIFVSDAPFRPAVGAAHCLVGFLIGFGSHIRAYFYAVMANDKVGMFDIFVNPLQIWRPVGLALPKTQRLVCLACAGSILFLGGVAMIGSDFNRIFEVGPRKKKKVVIANPGAALAKAAKEAKGDEAEELDEAVNNFAGQGEDATKALAGEAVSAADASEEKKDEKPRDEKPKPESDDKKKPGDEDKGDDKNSVRKESQACVVFGSLNDSTQTPESLLLAEKAADGVLRFVGRVPMASIPAGDLTLIQDYLYRSAMLSSAVDCPLDGQWVTPGLDCEIEFEGRTTDGRLRNPRWKTLIRQAASK